MPEQLSPIHNLFPVSKEVTTAIAHLPEDEIFANMDAVFAMVYETPGFTEMGRFLEERLTWLRGSQQLVGRIDREAYRKGALTSVLYLMCEAANRGGTLAEITSETIDAYKSRIYGSAKHKQTLAAYLIEVERAASLNYHGSSPGKLDTLGSNKK